MVNKGQEATDQGSGSFTTVVIFFLWTTYPISCLPSAVCYDHFRLIIHNNRIKTFVCIHHISLATGIIVSTKSSLFLCLLLPFYIFEMSELFHDILTSSSPL